MRLRPLAAAVISLPVLAFSSLAGPPGVQDESTCRDLGNDAGAGVCVIRTYFECTSDAPLEVQGVDSAVPLGYEPPENSTTAGAPGCGRADEPVFGTPTYNAYYEFAVHGYVDGNLDSLTAELYLAGPGVGQLGEEIELDVQLDIDGDGVFGNESGNDVTGEGFSGPRTVRVPVTPVMTNNGATVLLRFTVAGLDAFLGTAPDPDFGADTDRQIRMEINFPHTGDCQVLPPNDAERCAPSGLYAWAYGSAETPAGVAFNLPEDADLGTVLVAEDRGA